MGMSEMRANAIATNKQPLVKAVEVELLNTGYYAVNGACGHRLTVVRQAEADRWLERIRTQTRYKKRCFYCSK